MIEAIALVALLLMLAAGISLYLSLGIAALIMFWGEGMVVAGMVQVIVDHLNSSTLIAVPFFVIAATFMQSGGIAKTMVNAARSWISGVSGSLAIVCVLAAMVFSAIAGSSVATALAMGTILIPAMREQNYPRHFLWEWSAPSGTLGILIPPSLALIIYGVIAETSISKLFIAGIVPGLLQVLLFITLYLALYQAQKNCRHIH